MRLEDTDVNSTVTYKTSYVSSYVWQIVNSLIPGGKKNRLEIIIPEKNTEKCRNVHLKAMPSS